MTPKREEEETAAAEALVGSAAPEVVAGPGQIVVRLNVNLGDHRAGEVVALDDSEEVRATLASGLIESV